MPKLSLAVRCVLLLLAGPPFVASPAHAQAEPLSSFPRDFREVARGTVFIAHTQGHAEPTPVHDTLWRTDGTEAGTFELRLCSAACDPRPRILATGGGQAFFTAFDDTLEWTIWRTDGTQEGTRRLTAARFFSSPPEPLEVTWAADLGLFVFPAAEASGWTVWASDGTAAGTRRLVSLPAAVQRTPFGPVEHDGAVYFFLSPSDPSLQTYELWRSEGTPETTAKVTTLESYAGPESATSLPGGLVFAAAPPVNGDKRLWRTDGTAAGTAPIAAFGSALDFTPNLRRVGDLAWFWGTDEGGRQLWATDGSETGTRRLTALPFGSLRTSAWEPLPWRDGVLFGAGPLHESPEVWHSDGTPERTVRLVDDAGILVGATGDRFYFLADLDAGRLWESDGTPEGTRMAAAVSVPFGLESTPPLVRVDDTLFFRGAVTDGVEQLWALPVAGGPARQLTDFQHGFLSPFGHSWEVGTVGDRLVFAADDGEHGLEPWISDGTVAGTRRLADVTPGDFFPPCVPSDTSLCLGGGRFRVEVSWRDQHNGDEGVGHVVPAAGSDLSGYFWFFTPDNVELIVKVLDGSSINGFHWTFYGALTDVEYELTVTDTLTGQHRTYHNPPGEICGRGDTASLPEAGAEAEAAAAARSRAATAARLRALSLPSGGRRVGDRGVVAASHPAGACVPDDHTLCLLDGRFRVAVEWQDHHNGGEGVGGALPFSGISGFFWFFTPDNVELVVKALDATSLDGHFWFFYGALSDVGYTITVEDLVDGHRSRQYVNAPGQLCGRGDTAAFDG